MSECCLGGSLQSEEPSEAPQSSIPIRRATSAELTDCTQLSSLKCRLTSPVTVTLDAATLDALQSRHSRTATEAPLTKTGTRGGVKTARGPEIVTHSLDANEALASSSAGDGGRSRAVAETWQGRSLEQG